MLLKELRQICSQGEGQYLEFKQYASEPDQIIEEISGFLNSKGGMLIIGVKDDGVISGLKYPDDDINFISVYSKKMIVPSFQMKHEVLPISGKKSVIILDISEGKSKPYGIKDKKTNARKYLYRVNDECIKASRELRNILRQSFRASGQTIIYSDIEAAVLKEIDRSGSLTKADLMKKIEFNSRKISDCLIRLVTSKILKINPTRSGDLFEYNQSS